MSFTINTNIASLQAQNSLRTTNNFQSKTINRVTSGLRIVTSGDDAAGLAIANGFRSDGAVLTQGVRNANDGLSQLQTADGGINNISQLLDRARTLATQSASGAFTGDRSVLNSEFQSVIAEIDRQAQSIGLNTGGTFAKKLNVFIGGGQAANGISATTNGSVALDLSTSTVDSNSLGLKGVQAVGTSGTDIGSGSATTSLSQILANSTNSDSVDTPGFTTFVLRGPGFGGEGVEISVNTANLAGTDGLVSAVNAAIQATGNGGTQKATALKNANITAGIHTDSSGRQQLTFSSPSTAFQVEAGDRLANALLGKFEQNATLTGTDQAATVATNGGGTSATLTVAIDGGSAFSVSVTSGAATSKAQIVKDLNNDSTFNAVASASLEGNQIVLKSKGNSATSSISVTSTTLATNLGLSTTTATAAEASTGADLRTQVTAATETAAGATTFGDVGAGTIKFRFQGSGLSSPADVEVAVSSTTTVAQAITSLQNAVANNSSLKSAGIELTTVTAGNALTFTSDSGEAFTVQVTGDVQNRLGFGSFVTGANGAVDYNTLSGGSDYDASTAVGTNTFEISLDGGASSTNSIAVDLSGGDATAASVTGTNTDTSVLVESDNNTLNLSVNGVGFTVSLNVNLTGASKSDIANQINTVIATQGSASVVGNAIVIESNTKGAGGSVQIQAGTANTALGLAAGAAVTGTSRSGASIAEYLNQAFASDPQLQAAGLVADFGTTVANRITVKSTTGVDSFFRVNSRGSSAAASVTSSANEAAAATSGSRVLSGTGPYAIVAGANDQFQINIDGNGLNTITLNAGTRTVEEIVAELNSEPNLAGATAFINSSGAIEIASNSTGAGSTIELAAGGNDVLVTLAGAGVGTSTGTAAVTGYSIVDDTNDRLYISVDGGTAVEVNLTAGTRTAAQIAAEISVDGLAVTAENGHLKFTSTATGEAATVEFATGANDAYTTLGLTSATTYSGTQAETGFGVAGASFTGNVAGAPPAVTAEVEAGGSNQTSAFNFTPIVNGGADQTITVTAADSSGVQQSSTVTLRNDGTSRSGRSIDEALETINSALQQSNNATLQKIVAVKDNSNGTEGIRFLSTVSSFRVSVGSNADGTGFGSQGTTETAALAAGGATASIIDEASAQSAVAAVADAVAVLGRAQAVVGRGQNQFSFAINLAQSQLTNLAAAESRIRDADLAAESANLTKSQILLQAGIAALAQANSAPQQVLALLRA